MYHGNAGTCKTTRRPPGNQLQRGEYDDQSNPPASRSCAVKPVRILVADDHEVVRRGLRAILETREGWEVSGEAATGREAVEQAKQLKPDVVVLDLVMPEMNGPADLEGGPQPP